jgi:hypothetical protein
VSQEFIPNQTILFYFSSHPSVCSSTKTLPKKRCQPFFKGCILAIEQSFYHKTERMEAMIFVSAMAEL